MGKHFLCKYMCVQSYVYLFSGVNGEVSYSIEDGDLDGHFRIDIDTGAIYTKNDLDRETVADYNLVVMATDKAEQIDNRRSATAEVSFFLGSNLFLRRRNKNFEWTFLLKKEL